MISSVVLFYILPCRESSSWWQDFIFRAERVFIFRSNFPALFNNGLPITVCLIWCTEGSISVCWGLRIAVSSGSFTVWLLAYQQMDDVLRCISGCCLANCVVQIFCVSLFTETRLFLRLFHRFCKIEFVLIHCFICTKKDEVNNDKNKTMTISWLKIYF